MAASRQVMPASPTRAHHLRRTTPLPTSSPRGYALPPTCKPSSSIQWDAHHDLPAPMSPQAADISADTMWPSDDAIKAVAFEDARVAARLLIQLQHHHSVTKTPPSTISSISSDGEGESYLWRSPTSRSRKRAREPSPSDLDMPTHAAHRHTLPSAASARADTRYRRSDASFDDFHSHTAMDDGLGRASSNGGVLSGDSIFRHAPAPPPPRPARRNRSNSTSKPSRTSKPTTRRRRRRSNSDAARPRRRRRAGRPQNYVCGGPRDPRHFFLNATVTHLFPQQFEDLKARVNQQSHSGKKGRYYSARQHVCTGCKEVFKGGAPLYRRDDVVQDNLYRALRLQACLDVGMLPLAVGAGAGNHHNHNRDGHKESCAVAKRMQRLVSILREGVQPEGTAPIDTASKATKSPSRR